MNISLTIIDLVLQGSHLHKKECFSDDSIADEGLRQTLPCTLEYSQTKQTT